MQTTLTGHMDNDMIEDVTKALERFSGQEVKVTIEIFKGKRSKAHPPNTHQSQNAQMNFAESEDVEVR